jgi:hypothetical protein
MGDIEHSDLVPVARIFSRPEMQCFVAALQAEGILVFVGGDRQITLELQVLALGGYLVEVPAAQVEQAEGLIDELRRQTEPLSPAHTLRRGIWTLVAIKGAMEAIIAFSMAPQMGLWAILLVGGAITTPVPMTMPGDYRDRRGRLVQMR